MTKQQIEAVLERVRTWPEERQEDLAKIASEMERQGVDVYVLDEEEAAALDEAEAEGEASPEEVEAFFARYRR